MNDTEWRTRCAQSNVEKSCKQKVRYGSRQQAIRAARRIATAMGSVQRAYHCLHCQGFHLTRNGPAWAP